MKQLLPLFLLLAGCSPNTAGLIEARTEAVAVDLRSYAEEGFLFTPNGYAGEYEVLGLVSITMWPQASMAQQESDFGERVGVWRQDTVDVAGVLRQARDRAVALGGDALTNLQVTHPSRSFGTLKLTGVGVTGFAIRRR